MTASDLLKRLEKVKGSNAGRWMARCPAHDDRNPSLSVSEGRRGVVFHCHAGCSQEAVMSALGLEGRDLAGSPVSGNEAGRDARPEIETTYDYLDEDGTLLYQAVRYKPKGFRQRRPNGKGGRDWTLGDTRRVLYRLPEVLGAVGAGRTVYVVEGEKDVHAIEGLGGVATCCPMGAGKWRAEFSRSLQGAQVCIVADADDAGRAHAIQVAEGLRGIAGSVTILRAAVGKDAHDHAVSGRGLADFLPFDGDAVGERPAFRALRALLQQPELLAPPECVLPRIAFRGRAVLLCGPDKSGKSTLLAHGAAALSLGHDWFGAETRKGRVVWCGLEEAVGDAVRRFAELNADPDGVQVVMLADQQLLEHTDELLSGWPADLWVVDSLQEYARVTSGATPADGDNAAWGMIIRPLVEMARKHQVGLVMLHHVRRSDGEGRGATEIFAAVDATLTLRLPGKSDDPMTRVVEGRGRWAIGRFRFRMRDGQIGIVGGDPPSIDALVLAHVELHPGCSKSSLRRAVRGRGTAIDAAITRLAAQGAIKNLGTDVRPAWRVPTLHVRTAVQ